MLGRKMKIRGKYLHVETYGYREKPALLYLHGGPGETCYDFTFNQKERLEDSFYIVAIDQRGVGRSEAVGEKEEFGFQDLVEDCEALRKELGIECWSIVGHSFGGFLGLTYVHQYPLSIHKVIFECPTFDFGLTSKELLQKAAKLFEKYGMDELKKEAFALIMSDSSTRELTEGYHRLSDRLGEKRMEIYRYIPENPTDYYAAYSEEEWEAFFDNSEYHGKLLFEEGIIFESLLPKLKEVKVPMLLMTAEHDAVTCKYHIEAFKKDAENGETIHFEQCGHTPHYEDPDRFEEIVKDYLKTEVATSTDL
ncbi:alpha/beta fold hydrolase [Pseudalkalibacillus salsuginis]|uniref:alpha/beta fold hydrolase n=1 Tax=Pseudalkalibacillus salsuginis TaxID=2910972 RepID=UPI001F251E19|nr:alpha/beta hydrolase [Pseudalkalibacillus salsuginis]MCF6409928.1 alpha/beta hydrolase [Pseudalkalibacillus salsuginis]